MEPERRRFRRCNVSGSEIRVFTRDDQKFYSARDIGKAGLAFEYTPVEGKAPQSDMIDLLALDHKGRIYLPGIACKTVYDAAALMEGKSFKGGLEVRIRGLEFIELSVDQENMLDELLDQCFKRLA